MKAVTKETLGQESFFRCGKCRKKMLVLLTRGSRRIGLCACPWTVWELDDHDRATKWKPFKEQA